MKFFLLFFFTLTMSSCIDEPNEDSYKISSRCYVIAQDFIRKNLKHPKDAHFLSEKIVHNTDGYGKCTILGIVSSKNAFGVETEYIYKIWMSHNGKEWPDINNWNYSKIVFEDENKMQTVIDN